MVVLSSHMVFIFTINPEVEVLSPLLHLIHIYLPRDPLKLAKLEYDRYTSEKKLWKLDKTSGAYPKHSPSDK